MADILNPIITSFRAKNYGNTTKSIKAVLEQKTIRRLVEEKKTVATGLLYPKVAESKIREAFGTTKVCRGCRHSVELHTDDGCNFKGCRCMELKEAVTTDLRKDYEEKKACDGGTVYRKGHTIQAWWTKDSSGRKFSGTDGRETWTLPSYYSIDDVRKDFLGMVKRWNELDEEVRGKTPNCQQCKKPLLQVESLNGRLCNKCVSAVLEEAWGERYPDYGSGTGGTMGERITKHSCKACGNRWFGPQDDIECTKCHKIEFAEDINKFTEPVTEEFRYKSQRIKYTLDYRVVDTFSAGGSTAERPAGRTFTGPQAAVNANRAAAELNRQDAARERYAGLHENSVHQNGPPAVVSQAEVQRVFDKIGDVEETEILCGIKKLQVNASGQVISYICESGTSEQKWRCEDCKNQFSSKADDPFCSKCRSTNLRKIYESQADLKEAIRSDSPDQDGAYEASELGLRPGQWPYTLVVDGETFTRGTAKRNSNTGELEYVTYRTLAAGNRTIKVFND